MYSSGSPQILLLSTYICPILTNQGRAPLPDYMSETRSIIINLYRFTNSRTIWG